MGVGYNPRIVTDGLIAAWDPGNIKSYPDYNLLSYSQTFSNAYWTNTVSVDSTTELAPDGSYTATTLTDSNNTVYLSCSRTISVPSDSNSYNISIYVKKTTGGTAPTFGINATFSGGTANTFFARLNTDTGVVSLNSGANNAESVGNYWRMSYTATNNNTGNNLLSVALYPAAGTVAGGDSATTTGSATVWGIQATRGTALLPYRATAGTTRVDTLYDMTGNGNNGTLETAANTVTYANSALGFTKGSNSIITVAATSELKSLQIPLTICGWFNGFNYGAPPPWGAGDMSTPIFGQRYLNNQNSYIKVVSLGSSLISGKPNGTFYYSATRSDGTFQIAKHSAEIVANNWYYFAVVMSGNTSNPICKITINTTTESNTTFGPMSTTPSTTVPIRIGSHAYNLRNEFFDGSISSLMVYNRDLSENEVNQNFNALRGRFGI